MPSLRLLPLLALALAGCDAPATHVAAVGDAGACASALFCDDFESYPTGAPPGGEWIENQNGGTVAIDGTHVYSGTKAVKISAATAAGYRSVMIALTDPKLLPVAGNVVYGRMMFWLDSAPTGTVHWTFLDGSGLVPGQSYHAVYRYGGQVPIVTNGTFVGSQLMASYDTPDSYQTPPVGPSTDCYLHATTEVVPVGTWTCAEWEFDTAHDTMRYWENGAAFEDLTMTGTGQGCTSQPATYTWLAPTVQRIDLGWESYQADGARNLWIDDVAIGAQRIGCPPAP
jgi:hypothetical protein